VFWYEGGGEGTYQFCERQPQLQSETDRQSKEGKKKNRESPIGVEDGHSRGGSWDGEKIGHQGKGKDVSPYKGGEKISHCAKRRKRESAIEKGGNRGSIKFIEIPRRNTIAEEKFKRGNRQTAPKGGGQNNLPKTIRSRQGKHKKEEGNKANLYTRL